MFSSTATNLVSGQGDTNASYDTFLYRVATGNTRLVSHKPGAPAAAGNRDSDRGAISTDGSVVAFVSGASDLVTGQVDPGGGLDIFRYDRAADSVTLVTRVPGTTSTAARDSTDPLLSADGAYIAFDSASSQLVPGDSPYNDAFLFGPSWSDLRITIDDGVTEAVPGTTVTYTITATNAGPSDVAGATVADNLPAALTSASWTCAASARLELLGVGHRQYRRHRERGGGRDGDVHARPQHRSRGH